LPVSYSPATNPLIAPIDAGDGCLAAEKHLAEFLQTDVVEDTKLMAHWETLDLIGRSNNDGGLRLFRKYLRTGPMPLLGHSWRNSSKKVQEKPVRSDNRK
jgi:hypothetical protein